MQDPKITTVSSRKGHTHLCSWCLYNFGSSHWERSSFDISGKQLKGYNREFTFEAVNLKGSAVLSRLISTRAVSMAWLNNNTFEVTLCIVLT